MKKKLIGSLSLAAVVVCMASCGSKTETVETQNAQNVATADSAAKDYIVSAEETVLEWKATEKVGGGHNGKIKLAGGNLSVHANEIKAGKFEIDMTSMQVDDVTDPQKNAKLVGHLKNDDFFSVDKHPKATFEITDVQKGTADSTTVKGNLSIKGITKNISIPAKVTVAEGSTKVWADFSIDRTQWDIKYKSGTAFPELGDKAIDDAIQFKLALVAAKQ